jgi:hypothetical protein
MRVFEPCNHAESLKKVIFGAPFFQPRQVSPECDTPKKGYCQAGQGVRIYVHFKRRTNPSEKGKENEHEPQVDDGQRKAC